MTHARAPYLLKVYPALWYSDEQSEASESCEVSSQLPCECETKANHFGRVRARIAVFSRESDYMVALSLGQTHKRKLGPGFYLHVRFISSVPGTTMCKRIVGAVALEAIKAWNWYRVLH